MVAVSIAPSSSSLEALFAEQYPRLVAIAYRVLGDRADAEDVAQEAFVQFVRTGRQPEPSAPGWLSVAAAHRALNLIRSRKRRIARELAEFRLHRPLLREAQAAMDPLALLDRAQLQIVVRAALLRLRPRDAELLALRYGGSSYRELAQALGIDTHQIGTRLARAERALKKEIEHATLR